jgi:hypothetical protein
LPIGGPPRLRPAGGAGYRRCGSGTFSCAGDCADCSINEHSRHKEGIMGRGILLWLLGVPIPVIILILLFWR